MAATLRNPHICPVFDVNEIDGIHYITMAFIDGETLSHYLAARRDLTPRRVAGIVLKIASALQRAHENGVLHRDLKPSNIMIDRDGEPVVMDFGLARETEQRDLCATTQAGAIIGSPAYMSPEQIRGDDAAIGSASDVYSLGIIMHEMLTGELPYRGSVLSVFGQVLSPEPTPHAALAHCHRGSRAFANRSSPSDSTSAFPPWPALSPPWRDTWRTRRLCSLRNRPWRRSRPNLPRKRASRRRKLRKPPRSFR